MVSAIERFHCNSNNGLLSENGRYLLMLHNKGELHVYCLTKKIWSVNAAKSNASKMQFQIDGNLVLDSKKWNANLGNRH